MPEIELSSFPSLHARIMRLSVGCSITPIRSTCSPRGVVIPISKKQNILRIWNSSRQGWAANPIMTLCDHPLQTFWTPQPFQLIQLAGFRSLTSLEFLRWQSRADLFGNGLYLISTQPNADTNSTNLSSTLIFPGG
jgi:hypothetical protein